MMESEEHCPVCAGTGREPLFGDGYKLIGTIECRTCRPARYGEIKFRLVEPVPSTTVTATQLVLAILAGAVVAALVVWTGYELGRLLRP